MLNERNWHVNGEVLVYIRRDNNNVLVYQVRGVIIIMLDERYWYIHGEVLIYWMIGIGIY